MKGLLVIVPCGKSKIWSQEPTRGPTAARDAYTGAPFKVNREYAETFAERWVVLSAKHGFIPPDFLIPGPYNVTFKDPRTAPVRLEILRKQAGEMGLDGYRIIVGLGGKEYRAMIEAVFAGTDAKVVFPFAGMPIGKMMAATKRAIESRTAFSLTH